MMQYKNIVVLTGAGISAESGIATFRAKNGLWEKHAIEDVASPDGFIRDPDLVQSFYNKRRKQLLQKHIKPNDAHLALAQFEKNFSGTFTLITQNIDDLHERAGSHNIIHMHGELLKIRCQNTGEIFEIKSDLQHGAECVCCKNTGTLRPHIVWFGEMPLNMDDIEQCIKSCDLFVAIGTSGQVYPAAGFVQQANFVGAETVELNLEASVVGDFFSKGYYGAATKIVPQFFSQL